MGIDRRRKIVEQAWIGDAVLSLYARSKILREEGEVNATRFIAMTSNRFLNSLGEPASVEAEIGRVYTAEGLQAAFAWIEERLMPVFARQEANKLKRA